MAHELNRRELREHLFKILFEYEFYPEEQMREQLDLYLSHEGIENYDDREYLSGKLFRVSSMFDLRPTKTPTMPKPRRRLP